MALFSAKIVKIPEAFLTLLAKMGGPVQFGQHCKSELIKR